MDAFCYFIDHVNNDYELMIGTINFFVFFILLPIVVMGLFLYYFIKSGISIRKQILKHLQEMDEKKS